LTQTQSNEDTRLTEHRQHVWSENLVGSFRVFCGGVGLMTLFVLAVAALMSGPEAGLFAGSASVLVIRFGKFAFFIACFWGLLHPWTNFSEENAKECSRRKEMLARIEQDPDWSRKRDEKRQQRQKEQEELEAKLAAMGYRSDPDHWEALRRSQESLADLTHQLRDTKTEL
jgi:hypothetical protein